MVSQDGSSPSVITPHQVRLSENANLNLRPSFCPLLIGQALSIILHSGSLQSSLIREGSNTTQYQVESDDELVIHAIKSLERNLANKHVDMEYAIQRLLEKFSIHAHDLGQRKKFVFTFSFLHERHPQEMNHFLSNALNAKQKTIQLGTFYLIKYLLNDYSHKARLLGQSQYEKTMPKIMIIELVDGLENPPLKSSMISSKYTILIQSMTRDLANDVFNLFPNLQDETIKSAKNSPTLLSISMLDSFLMLYSQVLALLDLWHEEKQCGNHDGEGDLIQASHSSILIDPNEKPSPLQQNQLDQIVAFQIQFKRLIQILIHWFHHHRPFYVSILSYLFKLWPEKQSNAAMIDGVAVQEAKFWADWSSWMIEEHPDRPLSHLSHLISTLIDSTLEELNHIQSLLPSSPKPMITNLMPLCIAMAKLTAKMNASIILDKMEKLWEITKTCLQNPTITINVIPLKIFILGLALWKHIQPNFAPSQVEKIENTIWMLISQPNEIVNDDIYASIISFFIPNRQESLLEKWHDQLQMAVNRKDNKQLLGLKSFFKFIVDQKYEDLKRSSLIRILSIIDNLDWDQWIDMNEEEFKEILFEAIQKQSSTEDVDPKIPNMIQYLFQKVSLSHWHLEGFNLFLVKLNEPLSSYDPSMKRDQNYPCLSWIKCIYQAANMLFQSPDRTVHVKIFSTFSPIFSAFLPTMLDLITSKMQSQQDQLSQPEELENYSSQEIQRLLFDRLAPLLILKTLNFKAVQVTGQVDEEDYKKLVQLLCDRVLNTLEFEQIRKLSAELMARCHPGFAIPIILDPFHNMIKMMDRRNDQDTWFWIQIKSVVFYFCNVAVWYPEELDEWIPKIRPMIQVILNKKTTHDSQEKIELKKLQKGADMWISCIEKKRSSNKKAEN